MVRRNNRSIYDELDELKASMDYLFQLALEPADNPLLPAEERPEIICQSLHNINAEVIQDGDEVMITLDIFPGMDISEISVNLVNTETLNISCNRPDKKRTGANGQYLPGQRSFSLHHLIPLPVPVTKSGARTSLKNGVLDLHLKKAVLV